MPRWSSRDPQRELYAGARSGRPRGAVISSRLRDWVSDLGACVVDMSASQRSAAEPLFAEGAGELTSQCRVLGSEPVDLSPGGVETLMEGLVGCTLDGGEHRGATRSALPELVDRSEEVGLLVEPAA